MLYALLKEWMYYSDIHWTKYIITRTKQNIQHSSVVHRVIFVANGPIHFVLVTSSSYLHLLLKSFIYFSTWL